jgi:hypothetical protein
MQIRHSFTRGLSSILAAASLAWPVLAAAPQVLDIVPRSTPLVVAVSSLKKLDGQASELLGAMEARTLGSLSQALVAMGLRDGLDLEGSAAGLLYEPLAPAAAAEDGEPAAPTPRVLLLLPVSDAARFLATLQAKDDAGLSRFDYAGVSYFAKRIGDGHLAVSSGRDLIESFTAKPGNLEQYRAAIGARGREVLDRAPIVALGDPDVMRPMLERVLAPLAAGVPGMPGMGARPGAAEAGAAGGGPGGAAGIDVLRDPRTSIAGRLLRVTMDEASAAIVGIEPGALGLRIDAAAAFPDDAIMSRICRGDAEDPEPFRMLPSMPYLFAGATNTAHPGVRLMLDEFGPGPGSLGPQADAERAILAAASDMNTASVAIYAPPNMMFGVLTRTLIAWDARAPRDASVLFQKWLDSLAKEEVGANATKTKYTAGARTLGDVKVDEWSIEPPAGSFAMMPMFFGPVPGPQGLFAATDKFGYLQWSREDALMTAALKAAGQGGAASLQSDVMLSQVSELLPRPRAIEWYLDVRPLLKQVRSLMGDRAPLPTDMPDELPPIGAAIVMSEGSLQASAFIPAPLLRIAYFAWRESDRGPGPGDAAPPPPPPAPRPSGARHGNAK